MTRLKVAIVLVGTVLTLLVGTPSTSSGAASAYVFYDATWPSSNAPYYIRDAFPHGAGQRDRVQAGLATWSAVFGGSLGDPQFSYQGVTASDGNYANACLASFSGIYWRSSASLGSGNLAFTDTCEAPGYISRFSMSLNMDFSWYSGTGNPSSSYWDMQSIATHEAGHATGWGSTSYNSLGHYASSSAECTGATKPKATMCWYDPNAMGTIWMRTLEADDTTTYGWAYN